MALSVSVSVGLATWVWELVGVGRLDLQMAHFRVYIEFTYVAFNTPTNSLYFLDFDISFLCSGFIPLRSCFNDKINKREKKNLNKLPLS